MGTRCDILCLLMKRIINTVKSLVVSFCQKQKEKGGDNLYLPPEIIINILKRLRVKTLLRFQCVCKDWRNLLKSPSFITEHSHHSAHNNPLIIWYSYEHPPPRRPRYSRLSLLCSNKGTLEVERIPAMDSLRRCTRIIGSSNGLLCVQLGYEKDDPPPSLLLLNPATREVRQVPRSTNDDRCLRTMDSGFGYSQAIRDYKIVTIHLQSHLSYVPIVEVFSLRTGSWKEVGVIRRVIFHSESVTVNGAMFWLGCHCKDLRGLIVSFDLTTEGFTLISIPFATPDIWKNKLGVYNNQVAMYDTYKMHEVELWVLEQGSCAYGKRWVWSQKYRIRSTSLTLWRNELTYCNAKGESVCPFNVTTNRILKKFARSLSDSLFMRDFVYVESLVSLCT